MSSRRHRDKRSKPRKQHRSQRPKRPPREGVEKPHVPERQLFVMGMQGTSSDKDNKVVEVGQSLTFKAHVDPRALILEGPGTTLVIGWGVVEGIRLALPHRDAMLKLSRWQRFRRWLGGRG